MIGLVWWLFGLLWSLIRPLLPLLGVPTLIYLVTYFAPKAYITLMGPQDLKKKYGADWALVTGGSTGIGRAICDQLAIQGLNIFIVALDTPDLKKATDELAATFPKQKFVPIGVNFSPGQDYMSPIVAATKDVDVQIVFNNAGFIATGFFDTQPVGKMLANVECNSTSAVSITHLFACRMLQKKLAGCIVFTSSASGYIPNPFAITYGATKAFMSQFAASIAVELQSKGIDVCCIHPSPVASNFYNNVSHKIDAMEQFKKAAVDPSVLPKTILSAVGRCHLYDIGMVATSMRLIVDMLPYSFLARIISAFSTTMPDYIAHDKNRGQGPTHQ